MGLCVLSDCDCNCERECQCQCECECSCCYCYCYWDADVWYRKETDISRWLTWSIYTWSRNRGTTQEAKVSHPNPPWWEHGLTLANTDIRHLTTSWWQRGLAGGGRPEVTGQFTGKSFVNIGVCTLMRTWSNLWEYRHPSFDSLRVAKRVGRR